MADLSYLKLLYEDLNNKRTSLAKYADVVKNQLEGIQNSVNDGLKYAKQKYKAVNDYSEAQDVPTPKGDFSFETNPNKGRQETNPLEMSDLDDININLSNTFKEINYKFTKQQNNLQLLVTSHAEYQDLINQIFDTWASLTNGDDKSKS
jgi:hypothetical protein